MDKGSSGRDITISLNDTLAGQTIKPVFQCQTKWIDAIGKPQSGFITIMQIEIKVPECPPRGCVPEEEIGEYKFFFEKKEKEKDWTDWLKAIVLAVGWQMIATVMLAFNPIFNLVGAHSFWYDEMSIFAKTMYPEGARYTS